MKIGYARVSRKDQNENLQMDALNAAGCEKIFVEKISAVKNRPAFDECNKFIREGDTLVIWKIDRLGRSLIDLINIVSDLEKRGINFVITTQNIDTSTAAGQMFFQMNAVFAEYERNLLIERTQAGLAAARERGKVGGRKRALSEKQVTEIKENFDKLPDENKDFAKFAKIYKTSERTIRRVINDEY